jgi:cbb3-type cytochrome oxidase maturation protein
MSAIFILIIISLVVASGFLIAYIWAVRSGQFEDHVTPSLRMLLEDKNKSSENAGEKIKKEK